MVVEPIGTSNKFMYWGQLMDWDAIWDALQGEFENISLTMCPLYGVHFRVQSNFVIKKIDSSSEWVTINPYGSEKIDGSTEKRLNGSWDSVIIQSNGGSSGTTWYILAENH